MAQKPSIPKGTRDFSPAEMMRRTYIFETIKSVFRTYGFAPLETPSMENLSTLLGKYGDEGDKLLFKILNSGDYAAGLNEEQVRTASKICEKGLRYACPQNAHLRFVNSAFGGFASLENPLIIQFYKQHRVVLS